METVKNLNDRDRTGRAGATIPKQDQQIVLLAEQQTFITSRDITNQLNRKRVRIDERTAGRRSNEAGAKYKRSLSKPLLTENHQMNRFKWTQDHKVMDYNQMIFSDETTIRLNCVKELLWNLPGQERSCELSRIQSKSMFEVASQVKASVASSVLNKI